MNGGRTKSVRAMSNGPELAAGEKEWRRCEEAERKDRSIFWVKQEPIFITKGSSVGYVGMDLPRVRYPFGYFGSSSLKCTGSR